MGKNFHEGLRLVSHCPFCHARYRPFEATVVDGHHNAHVVHVQCRMCRSALLAVVYLADGGASSVGVLTDLTKEEAMKYRGAEEVSVDDVIEAHQLLHEPDL